jgi:hypothetical protein
MLRIMQRLLMPARVKIKAPRMRIDFNGDAVLGASLQDLIVVDLVSGASQGLASGHIPNAPGGEISIRRGLTRRWQGTGLTEDLIKTLSSQVWDWSETSVDAKHVQELNLNVGDRRLR